MRDASSAPRVSIVIPAYRSEQTVAACLFALRRQTFRNAEIIMVNSFSDATPRIVTEGFPEVVFEHSPARLLTQAARNRGVRKARGELLVFTDPDCVADADWLERLVRAHDEGHPVVAGSMDLVNARWLERGVHLAKFFWLLRGSPPGPCRIVCTANACYARWFWNVIGPFDEDFIIGDAIMSWRAAAAGHPPWLEPAAVVMHHHPWSLPEYLREFLARGREFAEARVRLERWSRMRAAAFVALSPLVLLVVLARTGRAAVAAGWSRAFFSTLPVQIACRAAWTLAEVQVACSSVFRRSGKAWRRCLRPLVVTEHS
jgi:GT2 family glycosyltransferase